MTERVIGPTGSRRRRRSLLGSLITALVLALALGVPAAIGSHPEVSLDGSNFEIDTDANLKLDDAAPPSIDWGSVAQGTTAGTEIRKQDTASGSGDESFGQGAKEDTPAPAVVDGSIPPNKSDLKFFGIYQEGNTSSGFLHMYWSRVQEPQGTTNMDFEFNQSGTPSANGITPVRTSGDLLVQYDLSQGGVNPVLFLSKWINGTETPAATASDCEASNSLPCWGKKVNLTTSGQATGSINTSPIPAGESDGLGGHSARTFGEASLSMTALFPDSTVCRSLGSAYLKSRSSDSFTSALKDFIPPASVNISNCGAVKIIKKDDAGAALAGAEFTLYKNLAPLGSPRGAEDTITSPVLKCTTAVTTGECTISNVLQGTYWVVETVVPAGHTGAADQAITVGADATVTVNFVNPRQRGAILVTKTRKHAASGSTPQPHAGVDFTVNGVTKATDANGKACFDNLLFASYSVHETTPAGYKGEADKTVVVDNSATCADSPYVGESVSFVNTPLSDITVSFSSQIVGGTAATIACTGLTATPSDSTPSAFDDTTETFKDLEPGTYTCTVVVDP